MKYRPWIAILLLSAALPSILAESVPEGESRNRLDRQTAVLSARLLFKEALTRWLAAPLPDAETALTRRMTEQADQCLLRADAERLMKPYYLELLQQRFAAMAAETLAPLRATLPAAIQKELEQPPQTLLAEKRDREFPEIFDAARRRLVAAQRAEITAAIYPTEAELEANDDRKLGEILTARFAERRGAPLWEELLPQLRTELIAPILKSAREQQQRQLLLAGQLTPDARTWEPQAAAADLERQLNAEIATWKAEKCYALFPRTQELIRQRSFRLPQERAIALLPGIAPSPDYAEFLAAAPTGNANPEISFRAYAGAIADAALETVKTRLNIPERYRVDLAGDAEVRQALDRRFQALKPQLQKLRDTVAQDQLQKRFPAVADGTFLPEPRAVESYREDKTQITLPPGADDPVLFAETRRLLQTATAARLAAGNTELSAQLDAVAAVYDAVVTEMEQLRDQGSPSWLARWFGAEDKVDLETIKACYTRRGLAQFLAGGKRNYPELFPKTAIEIDLRTRAILQRLSNPAEPQPRPQPASRTKPEDKETPATTYRIVVHTKNDQLVVRLKEQCFVGTLEPSRREAEEKRMIAEIAEALTELCRQAAQDAPAPPRFMIRIEVGDGAVYYRFIAELREALKETLRRNGAAVEDVLARNPR